MIRHFDTGPERHPSVEVHAPARGRPRGSLRVRAAIVAVGLAVGTILPAGGVSAASAALGLPVGVVDITASATGRALASAASSRFARAGVAPSQLVVLKDATGITVAPIGTQFVAMESTLADGTTGVTLAPVTPAAPSAVAAGSSGMQMAPLLSGSWGNPVASGCFARITDTWTYMDHCYQMWKESNDGSSTKDWFALRHYGTVFPNSPWVANYAAISSSPTSGSSAQSWADYSPLQGHNGNCTTITVGVNSPVAGISTTISACETWQISKDNPAVNFGLLWSGPGTRSSRGLDYEISVSVPQGGWPQWSLPASTSGSAF